MNKADVIIVGAGHGGEFGQRGLNIDRCNALVLLQMLCKPRGVEQVAPGAFGRLGLQKWFSQQR